MVDQPRCGFGYPITKNAKPRKGTSAVSSKVAVSRTKSVTGSSSVNCKRKQGPWFANLYFLFLMAVATEVAM